MITLVFVILFLLLFLVPLIASEVRDMVAAIPEQLQAIRVALEDLARRWTGDKFPAFQEELKRTVANWSSDWTAYASGFLKSLWSGGLALVNFLSLILVTPVVVFYLLLDWDKMVARIDSWLPRDHLETLRGLARDVDKVLAGFVRGQFTVCAILGTFYAVALVLAGLQFGLVVGLIAGLLTFIPYVGSVIGGILAIGLSMFQFWGTPEWIVVVAVIFVIGQVVEGNVLTPKLVGSSVGLHPVWLMFALSAFGSLMGITGMLVAVPVAASLGVFFRFGIGQYLQGKLYKGKHVVKPKTAPKPRKIKAK